MAVESVNAPSDDTGSASLNSGCAPSLTRAGVVASVPGMSPSPFPNDDPTRIALKLDLDNKRRTAQDRWAEFEEARKPVVESGKTDKATLARIDQIHQRYKDASAAAQAAEDQLVAHLDKSVGTLSGPERLDGIGRAFLKKIGPDAAKALADPSGGAIVPSFWDPRIRNLPQRQLFTRSVLPVRPTTFGMVDYLRQTVADHNAAPVPAGSVKPTSVYTVVKVEERVKTIAHVSEPVDRALLADNTSLESFLDQQLRLGVLLAEEDEIINGDGTGEHFEGILNVAGIGSYALTGGESAADAIYKGITTVRLAFYEPDAVVVHPNDFQQIRLSKTTAGGDYLAAPIVEDDPPTLWGKSVITSVAIAEGTALVGAFALGATIWDRETARVTFSESHDDLYVKNQVIFRGEERLAFGVERAPAFCEVTGI
jgi:HK97 family phage major capsid protein